MIRSGVALVLGLAGIAGAGVTLHLAGFKTCCHSCAPAQETAQQVAPQVAIEPVESLESVEHLDLAAQALEVEPQTAVSMAADLQSDHATAACSAVQAPLPADSCPSPCVAPMTAESQQQLLARKRSAQAALNWKSSGAKTAPAAKVGAQDAALLAKKQQPQAGATSSVATAPASAKSALPK